MPERFSETDRKAIAELIETGVTLSAERLGELSNTPWTIVSSSVEELPVVKLLSMFYKDETPHMGVHLKSRSILPLEVMMLFPESSAKSLTTAIVEETSAALKKLPDPQAAIICEISNIMGQGVLRSLANALKISIILDVPILHRGKKGDLLGKAFGGFDARQDIVMLSRIDMTSEIMATDCSMAIIFHVDLMQKLLKNWTGSGA
jgi:chemotaxis protein CheY-P-specific phosphatase CheC